MSKPKSGFVGIIAIATIASFVAGCATTPSKGSMAVESTTQLPVKLEPSFSSKEPDRYMVNSGPSQTYKPYSVNDWFKNSLSDYTKIRSGGEEVITVGVEIIEITTDYRSVGGTLVTPPKTHYGTVPPSFTPQVQNASTLASGGGNPLSVPTEVWKTVRLSFHVTIKEGENLLAEKKLTVEHIDHFDIRFDKQNMAWMYDYTEAFLEAIATALDRIGELLDETVGSPT